MFKRVCDTIGHCRNSIKFELFVFISNSQNSQYLKIIVTLRYFSVHNNEKLDAEFSLKKLSGVYK